MSTFDDQYIALCEKILNDGERTSNRTGVDTLKIFGHVFRFDLSKEFPILTSKFVAWKSAIIEMLWIYQAQSNDVRWLQDRGVKIWNEWAADENGVYKQTGGKELKLGKQFAHTIGTAYGWIVKKYGLTQNLIETLKTNPQDRRMIISLWQNEYFPTACLPSCVWNSQWNVTDGKLNLIVNCRSNDVPLGLPFNITQYAVLAHLLAQVAGLKVGEFIYVINDAHIYVNQIDGIREQIKMYREKGCPVAPKLWVNPDIKDFFKFDNSKDLLDIRLENYEYNLKISMPVAK
ncbi:MAG: thymidylate synthase [Christensenellaceae bacterium]|jgi:thymidylate synthase|nr:thymidylate synthase [Christensenellaceae bacterium]